MAKLSSITVVSMSILIMCLATILSPASAIRIAPAPFPVCFRCICCRVWQVEPSVPVIEGEPLTQRPIDPIIDPILPVDRPIAPSPRRAPPPPRIRPILCCPIRCCPPFTFYPLPLNPELPLTGSP